MHLVSLHRPSTGSKHLLNALEGLGRDERFMPAVEDLPFVRHHSDVVRVTENEAELVERQWPLLPLRGRPRRQPLL
ncbi:MAG: hypothetical protein CMH37_11365 [Microbacterium sp.]|nr:hypothetical protein [Microbacterium sp.]